jgi:hypothetical protein
MGPSRTANKAFQIILAGHIGANFSDILFGKIAADIFAFRRKIDFSFRFAVVYDINAT